MTNEQDKLGALESPSRFHSHGMIGTWLLGAEEEAEALQVLRSQSLFRHYGPNLLHKAASLELRVSHELGVPWVLALNSGTSALRCAIAALGIEPGDEVLVPACTFVATANAVILAGGVPVFVEVDETLGIDPDRMISRVTSRTRGVIPVHLQGSPCMIGRICEMARSRGMWVLEDAAQAMGARQQGRSVGAFGDAGAFSLQAHKTITCGEGGLLTTADERVYAAARRFSDQGGERQGDDYPDWDHPEAGFGENLKMSELHAAVALAQFQKLSYLRQRMFEVHAKVCEKIHWNGRTPRVAPENSESVPYSLIFFAYDGEDRQQILYGLEQRGIPADAAYSDPPYRQGPFVRWSRGERVFGLPDQHLAVRFEPCTRSEALLKRMVRIPYSPLFGDAETEHIADALNAIFRGGRR